LEVFKVRREALMSKYPQHEKLKARQAERDLIADFIDYLIHDPNEEIAIVNVKRGGEVGSVTTEDIQRLIAGYFDIDFRAFQAEKEAMYEELCEAANRREEKEVTEND
jgi:hypothetical protein